GAQTWYSNFPDWPLKALTRSRPWSLIANANPFKAGNVAAVRPDPANQTAGRLTSPPWIAPAINPWLLMAVAELLVAGGASRNLTPSVKDQANARWEPSALKILPTATR